MNCKRKKETNNTIINYDIINSSNWIIHNNNIIIIFRSNDTNNLR